MWIINLFSRKTGRLEVAGYASFTDQVKALEFASNHEDSFMRCGWYSVINWTE